MLARVLHQARQHGLKTCIDVVSEASDRFMRLVPPALKYTDYCIINEVEAQQTTGVKLRGEDERLLTENMPHALKAMKRMGVTTWAVIHCPEGGFGLDENDQYVALDSLHLPKGYIKGSVGAGDAFCAGVLYGAEKRYSLSDSIALGIASAACSLSEPGATEGMLKAKVREYALEDCVIFAGFVSDVAPYIEVMDAIINCSFGTEATSMALIEAMSLAKPAIATDYGGNAYIVENGKNGYIIPQKSASNLATSTWWNRSFPTWK